MKLTGRQNEILKGVIEGKSSKMIAGELGIHIKTVEYHRRILLKRYEVPNTAALVRAAVQEIQG